MPFEAPRLSRGHNWTMEPPHVSVLIKGWDVRTGTTGEMTMAAARLAEESGLDGIIAGDHVTFYGYGNDGLQTLTACAAVTERITLKTSVYLLPLRHPVPIALQVASLDQLSMGRLVLGVGIGGEDPHEFLSCGVDPRTRGPRTDEAIVILRKLWTEDGVSFAGRQFQLDDVTLYPKPLASVPIYVGGRSDAALRRAGRLGDGYTGIWQSPRRLREAAEKVAEAAAEVNRKPADIELGMQFWLAVGSDAAAARARLAGAMESMYGLPFDRFERYSPHGPVEAVAGFIATYVEAGARHVNLVVNQDSPEENIAVAAEIRAELRRHFRT